MKTPFHAAAVGSCFRRNDEKGGGMTKCRIGMAGWEVGDGISPLGGFA